MRIVIFGIKDDSLTSEEIKRSLSKAFPNECGNIVTSMGETSISCCGRKLESAKVMKANEGHKLEVEQVETEWYISCAHEMTKEHFISFVAIATGDKLLLTKQYPEWNIQLRLPQIGRGILFFYCTKDGLFSQFI